MFKELIPEDERGKIDRETKHLNIQLIKVLQSITNGFLILDKKLNIVYINQTAKDLICEQKEEYFPEENLSELFSPGGDLFKEFFQAVSEQQTVGFEYYCANSEKYLEIDVFPFQDGLFVYIRDITKRKMVEEQKNKCNQKIIRDISQRKHLEREIARLDSVHSLGKMVACIGHEIRNPMTTVRGFLQLLGEKEECNKFKDAFNLMIEELDRCNSIISEFLSLAKNRVLNFELCNLNDIIMSIAPLSRATGAMSDKNVVFELTKVPDLSLDQNEIRQLVLNLIRNALDAITPGKMLVVKTYMDGSDVVLAVKDQGSGIDASIIERIGVPFVTTKEQGIGLGLAVCYSIAARHNAAITFETGSGGTTFFVRFFTTFTQ